MATPLPVPEKILSSSSKTTQFNTISAKFGDSYTQEAPKGLNSRVDTWTVKWGALTLTEKQTVEGVLDTVGSWSLLSWTHNYETVVKYFKLDISTGYTTEHVGGNNAFNISCKLVEHFDVNP